MLGSWVRAPAGSRLIRQPQPFVLRLFFYVKVIMCKPTTTPDIKKHLLCRYVVLTPVRCGICAWVAGILVLMLAYGCANKVSPRASGKALRFEPQRDHKKRQTFGLPFLVIGIDNPSKPPFDKGGLISLFRLHFLQFSTQIIKYFALICKILCSLVSTGCIALFDRHKCSDKG